MKVLILILFISLPVGAIEFGLYQSLPDGSSSQVFNLSSKEFTYSKRSNAFDEQKDWRLGQFKAPLQRAYYDELEKILTKIKSADKVLRQQNSSFNELTSATHHEPYFLLDSYKVGSQSDLYSNLKRHFGKLQKLNWIQQKGIKVIDLKDYWIIRDAKETEKKSFNLRFHCKDERLPTVCSFKDLGILFIK